MRRVAGFGWLLAFGVLATAPGLAQELGSSPSSAPAGQPSAAAQQEAPGGFWEQTALFGNLGGGRRLLADHGVTLGLTETSEIWADTSGGIRRGVVYDGATQAVLNIDLEKAFGWTGGAVQVSAYQIHGRAPTANLVGALQPVSGVEADRATRLYDLWLEQRFWGGKLSVRVGQMGADEEFILSHYATTFVNSAFGWPGLPAVDLPSGGPAYPLATPGVRVKVQPTERIAFLGAVFDGNPAGPGSGDPQLRDASGTLFRVGDGVFAIAELQYQVNQGEHAAGLAGTYKIGAWYKSNAFADPRYDVSGMSLAGAAGNVVPASHRGDYSLYAVLDQMVLREPEIGVFARIMFAPGDRNLVSSGVNAGATWKGAIPGRGGDTLGLGLAYLRIGDAARGYDRDFAFATNAPYPVRDKELVLEATYQAQIAGWWQVQPDLQYVIHPGGNVPNPNDPAATIRNATVLGLRTTITF